MSTKKGKRSNLSQDELSFQLVKAAGNGIEKDVERYIEQGAPVNQFNSHGSAPMSTRSSGVTALMMASCHGHVACARRLIIAGADVNLVTDVGSTALVFAAQDDREEVCELLLSAGANVNTRRESDGGSPLAICCQMSNVKTTRLLIEAGGAVNARMKGNSTCLMVSSNVAVVKELLANKADATMVDNQGWNALHYRAWNGNSGVVMCMLVKAGCDPTLRDLGGDTPADVARRQGHADAAAFLTRLAEDHVRKTNAAREESKSAK